MKRMIMSLVAAIALSATVFADSPRQEAPADNSPAKQLAPQPQAPVKEADKSWSFTGGIDFQSKYIFRGFTITKNGVIAQPYGQLSFKAYDQNDLTISPYIGTWNNVTSRPLALKNGKTNSTLHYWSETDIDAGVTTTYKNFTVGINYIYYLYPNGSINEDQEIGVSVGYDDSEVWKDSTFFSAVNPHVAYYHEIRNQAGTEGGYIEIGVEPTLQPVKVGSVPVTFSTLLTLD
jgi:hypothetical protein